MKLYLIHSELYFGVSTRLDRLRLACQKLDVESIILDAKQTNHLLLPTPGKGDMLYRLSDGGEALENFLLNGEVATFYIQNPAWVDENTSTNFSFLHLKSGIPQPKTIFDCYTIDRKHLQAYANYLGFPLVIKAYGGSRGIGIIKIDGWQSFVSCIDFLVARKERFIIREFIHTNRVYRLMVLGNNVIASWFSHTMDGDFRNASHPTLIDLMSEKTPCKLDERIEQVAIEAVLVCNLEFGAVDLLFDANHIPYILEVNFPCGLNYDPMGKNDIAEKMVSFLKRKSLGKKMEHT